MPSFPLVFILFYVLLWTFWNKEVEGSLVSSIPKPLSNISILHWFILRKISVISREHAQCKIYLAKMAHLCLSTYASVCLFMPCCMACESLVLWPGVEPRPSAVKVLSPQHWTATELNQSWIYMSKRHWQRVQICWQNTLIFQNVELNRPEEHGIILKLVYN